MQKSEVGGENGAERSPPPGIQAERPSPSHRTHRTHDTTDQWRDRFRWLGRTEADFPIALRASPNGAPSRGRVVAVFSFVFTRNYNGFVEYMESTWCLFVHFSQELHWFGSGHGLDMASQGSIRVIQIGVL